MRTFEPMTTMTLDPEARLDDDERLLFVPEFDLPADADDEQVVAIGHDFYDGQILAALVTF